MFVEGSPFDINPKVNVDKCLEVDSSTGKCKISNGTLEYFYTLRCLSRQTFPNDTVINESSLARKLNVVKYVDDITAYMEPPPNEALTQTNVGATVITALIVILVFIAISLLSFKDAEPLYLSSSLINFL